MFVTHLLYSVIEDTTSGCKIKKNSDFPNSYANNLQNFFPGGTANDRSNFWRHIGDRIAYFPPFF